VISPCNPIRQLPARRISSNCRSRRLALEPWDRRRRLIFEPLEARRLLTLLVAGTNYGPAGSVGIQGTAGDDVLTVTFQTHTSFTLTLNGVATQYSTIGTPFVDYLVFDGNGGHDTTIFKDPFNTHQIQFLDHDVWVNTDDFLFRAVGTANNTVYGTVNDKASFNPLTPNLIGTPYAANAAVVYTPDYLYLQTPDSGGHLGVFDQVVGVRNITVQARGDYDTAMLYPAAGGLITSTPQQLTVQAASSLVVLLGFQSTTAFTTASDRYYAFPGPVAGSDRLVATPTYAYVQGNIVGPAGTLRGFFDQGVGFKTVVLTGQSGDQAFLYDSPGNDTLVERPDYSYLTGKIGGATFFNEVQTNNQLSGNFTVTATSSAGGQDQAYFYALSRPLISLALMPGENLAGTFTSSPGYSLLKSEFGDHQESAYGFSSITAIAQDRAVANVFVDAGRNVLNVAGNQANLFRSGGGTLALIDFQTINAIAPSIGVSRKQVAAHDAALNLTGLWQ
jgi:hypothetical protein